MLIALSFILKAACVNSGEIPRIISMGTKIGAKTAHLEVVDATNRFKKPVKAMIPKIVIDLGKSSDFINSAPLIAISLEILELLKTYKNCEQIKQNIINGNKILKALIIESKTSLEPLNFPDEKPKTSPGIAKNKNRKSTIPFIKIPSFSVREPLGPLSIELEGKAKIAKIAIKTKRLEKAKKNARFSFWLKCLFNVSMNPSIGKFFCKYGSTIFSHTNQHKSTTPIVLPIDKK